MTRLTPEIEELPEGYCKLTVSSARGSAAGQARACAADVLERPAGNHAATPMGTTVTKAKMRWNNPAIGETKASPCAIPAASIRSARAMVRAKCRRPPTSWFTDTPASVRATSIGLHRD